MSLTNGVVCSGSVQMTLSPKPRPHKIVSRLRTPSWRCPPLRCSWLLRLGQDHRLNSLMPLHLDGTFIFVSTSRLCHPPAARYLKRADDFAATRCRRLASALPFSRGWSNRFSSDLTTLASLAIAVGALIVAYVVRHRLSSSVRPGGLATELVASQHQMRVRLTAAQARGLLDVLNYRPVGCCCLFSGLAVTKGERGKVEVRWPHSSDCLF